MKKVLLAGVTAAALGFAGSANAGLTLTGTAGTIPGAAATNAALAPVASGGLGMGTGGVLGGYYGATIYVDGPGTLTFSFLGFEAAANNTFNYTGAGGGSFSTASVVDPDRVIFSNSGVAPSFTVTVTAAGMLAFNFTTDQSGTVGGNTVSDGADPVPSINDNRLNYFATFNTTSAAAGGPTSGNVLYLFLDDTGTGPGLGSNGDDDNHDDMVIRVTFNVPEPATLALFGAGLLGLGAAVRRRRKA